MDGSSRCNPGLAGIGIVIITPEGKVAKEISRFIGVKTNNQAEYEALITSLKEAKNLIPYPVVLQTDSELLFYQLTGKYRVKNNQLKPLYNEAKRLLARLPNTTLNLVPRKANILSDRLAKKASNVEQKSLVNKKKTI